MLKWRLGSLAGFPIEIKSGFLLLLLIAMFGGFGGGGLAAIGFVAMIFASIVLHELGHAVVARRRGVGISGIELGFFGGAAKMTSLPNTANDEIAIAAAGPAVSLMISGVALLVADGLHGGALDRFAFSVGVANAVIAIFNLLPALPMDGGRILRAVLSRWSNYVTATDRSVSIARVVSVGFVVLGIMFSWQLMLLAPLLWMMGSREKMMARMMASQYTRGPAGYRVRRFDEIEVLPREAGPYRQAAGYSPGTGANPFDMFAAMFGQRRAGGNVSVSRRNGKIVIEIDPQ
ncbi:MAG: M50 family metallopeptidase [Kofleriaceae bacterium]|nr:M50 family metallopeptidase [Kofleriaceae bacterium]